MRALAAVAALVVAVAAPAQSPRPIGRDVAHDVPLRGAHLYARKTDAFEVSIASPRIRLEWLVQGGGDAEPHAWRWLATKDGGPAGFELPDFDDAAWALGKGEFGGDVGKPAAMQSSDQRTAWTTPTLCLRTTIDAGGRRPRALAFRVDHDDGVRIWLNGKQVVANDGYGRNRWYVVHGKALEAWLPGKNTLAVRCAQIGGAQYLDVALAAAASLPAAVKSGEDILRVISEEQNAGRGLRGQVCAALRPPAVLLHGELDAADRSLRLPPTDLRDLAFWAAMDLRPGLAGGPYAGDIGRVWRFGDIKLRGAASPVGADGWQTLELTVRHEPKLDLRGETERFVEMHIQRELVFGLDARLEIRRRLTHKDGRARVEEFASSLQGKLLRGKDLREHAGTITQRETWRHKHMLDGQDAKFRAAVEAAQKAGMARLRELLKEPDKGDLSPEPADGPRSYHAGSLALGLLGLVKAGAPKDDEILQKGLAELRKRTLIDTYTLGTALMLMNAMYGPKQPSVPGRRTADEAAAKPKITAEDMALVRKWTERLLANIDTRVDSAELLRFSYVGEGRFDNSVNQYGLLGMYAAQQCGVPMPPTAWQAAANHMLATQVESGAKLQLDLTDFATVQEMLADPDFVRGGTRPTARIRGWSYHEGSHNGEDAPTWGSMVCSGITGLAICEAGLRAEEGGRRNNKLLAEIRGAREDGFAWLAQHMTVRHQPGEIGRQCDWLYYYLYGLERSAMLSGVALIQGRDWFFEAATVLMQWQQANGDWPDHRPHGEAGAIYRIAMAMLCLSQGTPSVVPITGK